MTNPDPVKLLEADMAVWVYPMTFGKGRLCIGKVGLSWYDDGWCYESYDVALAAAEDWDGRGEPEGWFRHPTSGRRRPEGDPAQEYVAL
jgi:hypothetical protein